MTIGKSRKTIMSWIVSNVDHPAECYDVKRCNIRKLENAVVHTDMAEGWEPVEGKPTPDEQQVYTAGRVGRIATSIFQVWARMAVGSVPPKLAVEQSFMNMRRGAANLERVDTARAAELLDTDEKPRAVFDALGEKVAGAFGSDLTCFTCDRDLVESVARLRWFNRFYRNPEIGVKVGYGIGSVTVDDETAMMVADVVDNMIRIAGGVEEVADHRHREYAPRGSKTIKQWEYELCTKETVWLVSFAARLATSRIAAMLVATYFFMLDSGWFSDERFEDVRAIGCMNPATGEYFTIGFDEIDETSARVTMVRVNGFSSDRIEELAGAFDPDVRKDITAKRIAERKARGEKNRLKKAKLGSVTPPSRNELEDYLSANGRDTLSAIVKKTVRESRGGAITIECYDEVGGIDYKQDELDRVEGEVGWVSWSTMTYVVQGMLRCWLLSELPAKELFPQPYSGAEELDSHNESVRRDLGIAEGTAVEYLEGLVAEAKSPEIEPVDLATLVRMINWFGWYASDAGKDLGISKPITGGVWSEAEAAMAGLFFERVIIGFGMAGGGLVDMNLECAPPDNRYIAKAPMAYVTDNALVRVTYAQKPPAHEMLLADAMTWHFGIRGGLLSDQLTLAVVNPRFGKVYVLPRDKTEGALALAASAAAPFEVSSV